MTKRIPLLLLLAAAAFAQGPDTIRIWNQYSVTPNITYLTANNYEAKLDVYRRRGVDGLLPTVIAIHGGGWTGGTKESTTLFVLPYLEAGFNVVNVEYRLARVSLAPAAVEDCRCALKWVYRNAKEYGFDTSKLILTGGSAGGHLALITGMLPESAGLDRYCTGGEEPKVAAIVNWYGITDVADLLDGPNMKSYAVTWLGSQTDRVNIAKRVSPMTYVRSGLPTILTIHGDADPTVPYQHGVQLTNALKAAGVKTELVTVPGGKHGGFTLEENLKIFQSIRAFLGSLGLTPPPLKAN
ncbi:MAG TPA: alpha/beta hydrolase [Bryobacteraceae bacterium]|nr:alpha/beta hydrolase [Bryobacteraceae bacterium]HPT26316.1 alpha/beta hydrolase [Bryobacteraceae bacterium]